MTVFVIGKGRAQELASAWLLLALLALALSTACAIFVVAARVPMPTSLVTSIEWFRRALVLHVSLAVIVWFLCCAAGLWTLAADGLTNAWGRALQLLAAIGLVCMIGAPFFAGATPVLANYVPVLDSPGFLLGLLLFFFAVSLSGVTAGLAMIGRARSRQVETWRLGIGFSIVAALIAAASLLASLKMAGVPENAADFERLAWAPGHILQFVHILLLMSVWIILAEAALGGPFIARRWLLTLLVLETLPLLAAPLIYAAYPVGSADFRLAFTNLMRWGSWPPAAMLALCLLWKIIRINSAIRKAQIPLLLSVSLFLLGCVFGALIRGESTMVPAHYHCSVGAVTLAYMALGYRLLTGFDCATPQGRLARWQPCIYGMGTLVLASALAWSGWLGIPRKTLYVDVITQYPSYFVAMGLAGVGGFFAISGAGMFVVNIFRSVSNRMQSGFIGRISHKTRHSVARGVGIAFILAMGLCVFYWSNQTRALTGQPLANENEAKAHVIEKRKLEIERRFSQGVGFLTSKQFDAASKEFHRVLELAPEMPEAHVNMGYAMLGTMQYAIARDFFNSAISLNARQLNAYYGLALANEGLGDLPVALSAMRTFVHLSKIDDAYVPRANSAIGRWEAQLGAGQRNNTIVENSTSFFPENESGISADPIRGKKIN